jgi:hypothetical protein
VEKRFSAGKIVFLDPVTPGFLKIGFHRLQGKKAKGLIARAAANKAVGAGKVAKGTGNLEPQGVKRLKREKGSSHAWMPLRKGCS